MGYEIDMNAIKKAQKMAAKADAAMKRLEAEEEAERKREQARAKRADEKAKKAAEAKRKAEEKRSLKEMKEAKAKALKIYAAEEKRKAKAFQKFVEKIGKEMKAAEKAQKAAEAKRKAEEKRSLKEMKEAKAKALKIAAAEEKRKTKAFEKFMETIKKQSKTMGHKSVAKKAVQPQKKQINFAGLQQQVKPRVQTATRTAAAPSFAQQMVKLMNARMVKNGYPKVEPEEMKKFITMHKSKGQIVTMDQDRYVRIDRELKFAKSTLKNNAMQKNAMNYVKTVQSRGMGAF